MTTGQQLKLQAYLDGELPEREAREIAAWVQRDRDAALLLAELKNTREAIANAEPLITFPESREFYWSKIAREIQKLEPADISSPTMVFDWRRLLWPVGLTAGAVVVCFLAVILENAPSNQLTSATSVSADADMPIVESAQADSEAITYQDNSDGTTLVWFSADENSTPTKTF